MPITPRVGRFYPQTYFHGAALFYGVNQSYGRIIAVDNTRLTVDLNHPLSDKDIDLLIQVDAIKTDGKKTQRVGQDIISLLCDTGPGMQDRMADQETDFWSDNPFGRLDTGDDADFFKSPSLSPFWDRKALNEVTKRYNELIPQNSRILDLMAGAHTPLQESIIKPSRVIGAGLNQIELEHNPVYDERRVLNVNTIQTLPFENSEFDVVLIHAAIEYVINPDKLFYEISRVLKPGGRIIISFSNRSVTQKCIKIWSEVQDFERPGIVLSYLRSSDTFCNFKGFSKRGPSRSPQDKLAKQLPQSDPVYVVWADKKTKSKTEANYC